MTDIFRKTLITKDNVRLYYETYNFDGVREKPVLFLVHGVGGDLDAWEYVRDLLLKENYSIIALDLRGHGYSSHPYASAKYSFRHFADDIAAILEKEKIQKVILIGHSYGASIALATTLMYPDKIEKLIAISPAVYLPDTKKAKLSAGLQAFILNTLSFISLTPIKPGHSIYPRGKFHKDYELFGLFRTIFRNSIRSYLLSSKLVLQYDFLSKIKVIQQKTLIISGEKDSVFPSHIAKKIQEKIPNSEFKLIPNANHVVILNNIGETVGLIREFLTKT